MKINQVTRKRALALLLVLVCAFTVRALTMQFVKAHLSDPGWFQSGSYAVFDEQAQRILDGKSSIFWIRDPSDNDAIVYPPGYPVWLALIYSATGMRSAAAVQSVQWILDALSVLLIVGIGATAYGWGVGIAAGFLAAFFPVLALVGATPMADAPTSWVVLCGAWMLLLAAKRRGIVWAFGAGLMAGASCWLRANALLLAIWWAVALLLFVRINWRKRASLCAAVLSGAALIIAPVMIRNALRFHAFVPTGLGVGTNLWEGIGETDRAAEFGAVYGDGLLLEQERAAAGPAGVRLISLYAPDGVVRDRERARKALAVIAAHPVWYAGVMAHRIYGIMKYAGKPLPIYGSMGINVTARKCLPHRFQDGALAFAVNLLGMAQSVLRYTALPLMLFGLLLALRRDWRVTGLILTSVLYYLVAGTALHTEIRYGLPMHALLIVFAGVTIERLASSHSHTTSALTRIRHLLYGPAPNISERADQSH